MNVIFKKIYIFDILTKKAFVTSFEVVYIMLWELMPTSIKNGKMKTKYIF